jgi:hypothetical protein
MPGQRKPKSAQLQEFEPVVAARVQKIIDTATECLMAFVDEGLRHAEELRLLQMRDCFQDMTNTPESWRISASEPDDFRHQIRELVQKGYIAKLRRDVADFYLFCQMQEHVRKLMVKRGLDPATSFPHHGAWARAIEKIGRHRHVSESTLKRIIRKYNHRKWREDDRWVLQNLPPPGAAKGVKSRLIFDT